MTHQNRGLGATVMAIVICGPLLTLGYAVAEPLNVGQDLYQRLSCHGCHVSHIGFAKSSGLLTPHPDPLPASGARGIKDKTFGNWYNCGGKEGPALDGVGRRLTRGDLETQILTPRQRQADSRMPSFAFVKPSEIQDLLDFLQSLK